MALFAWRTIWFDFTSPFFQDSGASTVAILDYTLLFTPVTGLYASFHSGLLLGYLRIALPGSLGFDAHLAVLSRVRSGLRRFSLRSHCVIPLLATDLKTQWVMEGQGLELGYVAVCVIEGYMEPFGREEI